MLVLKPGLSASDIALSEIAAEKLIWGPVLAAVTAAPVIISRNKNTRGESRLVPTHRWPVAASMSPIHPRPPFA